MHSRDVVRNFKPRVLVLIYYILESIGHSMALLKIDGCYSTRSTRSNDSPAQETCIAAAYSSSSEAIQHARPALCKLE